MGVATTAVAISVAELVWKRKTVPAGELEIEERKLPRVVGQLPLFQLVAVKDGECLWRQTACPIGAEERRACEGWDLCKPEAVGQLRAHTANEMNREPYGTCPFFFPCSGWAACSRT